jgi:hypothetical protein
MSWWDEAKHEGDDAQEDILPVAVESDDNDP